MAATSAFNVFSNMNKRTIRAPVNPLDKSTVVNIMPRAIHETKHTIQPGVFDIPAGSLDRPAILVVGPSSWWRDVDEDQPLLEIPVSSIQIANSIVKDFCSGILACNMSTAMPGLFFFQGVITAKDLRDKFPHALEDANIKQLNWYSALIKLADALWARSNGNPLTISDDMRMAARELNLQSTKDWMKDYKMIEMVRCFACGAMKNPLFPVCATCRAIDQKHDLAKEIKFAG